MSVIEDLEFVDCNIVHNPENPCATVDSVRMAVRLGYSIVCINQYMDSLLSGQELETENPPAGKKRKIAKLQIRVVPEPFLVPRSDWESIENEFRIVNPDSKQRLRQFSRISCVIENTDLVHTFVKNEFVKKYDIVAVVPESDAVFTSVTKRPEVDILTFDPRRYNGWLSRPKMVRAAIEAGITLEFMYTHVLFTKDREERRKVLASGHRLWRTTRGKGVLISSGGEGRMELRSPLDVMGLASVWGASMPDARRSISEVAMFALRHAQSRKTVGGAVCAQSWEEVDDGVKKMLKGVEEFGAECVL